MIAFAIPQTMGLAIPHLQRVRASYPLPTRSAFAESPKRADDSRPGSASLRAQPWVKSHKNPSPDCEAARSAKFICGCPIRPISPIRPIPPHAKSTIDSEREPLIKVDSNLPPPLSPTCYRPIIRPENKGIKPITNRHKPKKFLTLPLIKSEKNSCTPSSSILNPAKPHYTPLNPTKHPPHPR
jgi:hypothetical protein